MTKVEQTGPHTPWTPRVRDHVDRLQAWAIFWVGMLALTCAGAFVLVPENLTWRHAVAGALIGAKGTLLMIIAWKMRQVATGRGRRRFR